MPRILGVDLPQDKPTHISLRYIYGIGPTNALEVCEKAGIDPMRKAREITDIEIARLATILEREYVVEGQLRRQTQQNIARLRDIGCYQHGGCAHRRGLPCPEANGRVSPMPRTRKGPH